MLFEQGRVTMSEKEFCSALFKVSLAGQSFSILDVNTNR